MSRRDSKQNRLNLWDGLSVTFVVQRSICIFPFIRRGNEIIHSLFATIYSIISVIFYLCSFTLALYILQNEQTTKKVETVRESDDRISKSYLIIVIAVFELVFNNVGILVIFSFSHIKKNTHIIFLQKLFDVDSVLLDELKANINYNRLRVMSYTAYISIFMYYLGMNCLLFRKLNELQQLTTGVAFMATLYQFQQSTTSITTWTYVNYVMLLHQRFVLIRKRQEELVKEKKMILKSGIKYTENVSLLSTLLITYKELCACIDVLNDLSGSILILRIAHDFTLTTSQVYLISWIIMDNTGSVIIIILRAFDL